MVLKTFILFYFTSDVRTSARLKYSEINATGTTYFILHLFYFISAVRTSAMK